MNLKAPFPYFGGKSNAVDLVWPRFGAVRNYVEPFFGSGAMLLGRPEPWNGTETVNDADGMISNFWRALKTDPDGVAEHADWPVNENDLHARHAWIVERKDSLQARLEGDPDFYDPKIAGWWVWGISCWIGSGFCSGNGPWHRVQDEDGNWTLIKNDDAGRGVRRQRVHLGSACRGVNRQIVHLSRIGQGVKSGIGKTDLLGWFETLAARLSCVRVCCGDWQRICGMTPTKNLGLTAVFLDPPYADTANRAPDLYRIDSASVAHDVRKWCLEHGDDPQMRIALCGYEGEHEMPSSWACIQSQAGGSNSGYGNQKRSLGGHSIHGHRERIWFSPHCLKLKSIQHTLFLDEC